MVMLIVPIPLVWYLYEHDIKDQKLSVGHEQLNKANQFLNQMKIDKAISLYREMLLKERGRPDAGVHYNMAIAYATQMDWIKSAIEAQAALEDCSNFGPAATLLKNAYTAMGRGRILQKAQLQYTFWLAGLIRQSIVKTFLGRAKIRS
jgi:tetratricopeptide (TPR) repeat protein